MPFARTLLLAQWFQRKFQSALFTGDINPKLQGSTCPNISSPVRVCFHRDIASAIKELLDTVNNVIKKYQYQNRRVGVRRT